jgi:hypothetical protein
VGAYTDKQNVQIAWKEYQKYSQGEKVKLPDGTVIGYVAQVLHDPDTGLDGYVITDKKMSAHATPSQRSNVQTVTVLYEGSHANVSSLNDVDKTRRDWIDNDFAVVGALIDSDSESKEVPEQLKLGSRVLDDTFDKYPNANVNVYGHSLGSMVGQYAVANLNDKNQKRLAEAHLYEGMNIYPLLTNEQKKHADELTRSGKVRNYVDPKDLVPWGTYDNGAKAVGTVTIVKSKKAKDRVKQHMWGGYQFNKDGSLKIVKQSAAQKTSKIHAVTQAYTSSKLSSLAGFRKKLVSSGGGLSGSQTVMLDEASAYVAAATIEHAFNVADADLKVILKKSRQELSDIWIENINLARRLTPDLSDDEILDALEEVGVTKRSIVLLAQAGFDSDLAELHHAAAGYESLVHDVRRTITEMKGADNLLKTVIG